MIEREDREPGHQDGRGERDLERDHAERDKDEGGRPIVQVLDSNTNREVKFHMRWTDTLKAVWDRAYEELGEARVSEDEFTCQDGPSLTPHLGLTLAQARAGDAHSASQA